MGWVWGPGDGLGREARRAVPLPLPIAFPPGPKVTRAPQRIVGGDLTQMQGGSATGIVFSSLVPGLVLGDRLRHHRFRQLDLV